MSEREDGFQRSNIASALFQSFFHQQTRWDLSFTLGSVSMRIKLSRLRSCESLGMRLMGLRRWSSRLIRNFRNALKFLQMDDKRNLRSYKSLYIAIPVSLLEWCWDWIQGGNPIYAAVFCLSSCHGHICPILVKLFAKSACHIHCQSREKMVAQILSTPLK